MMAFLYTLVAELTGLSCIIGACIAVISCSSLQLIHSNEFRKGTECLQIIFSAIFFVSPGVITDFRTLIPTLVWFLVVLTIIAIISRVAGCGIPAKFFGIFGKDSLIIGFGMVPGGEFAMIVAFIGLQQGIIEQGNLSDPRHHEYDNNVIYPSSLSELAFLKKKRINPLCQYRRIESWNPAGFSYSFLKKCLERLLTGLHAAAGVAALFL